MFISAQILIVLFYVYDCIFFAKDKDTITEMIEILCNENLKIKPEQDMAGFLGILINRNKEKGTYTLTQAGLIKCIIKQLGLEGANHKQTPAEFGVLPVNKNRQHCDKSFNYASIFEMLSYLSGQTRPELEFAIHRCGCYAHNPCAIYEVAAK